jgi:hypothetical protein
MQNRPNDRRCCGRNSFALAAVFLSQIIPSMPLSRRQFLSTGFKSLVLISAGGVLQSFSAGEYGLPEKSKIRLRFAIASDGHYGQPQTAYEAMHDEMINWLNKEKRGRGLDFSFLNGDLIHDDASYLPAVKSKFDRLAMPYYVSHGNHDRVEEPAWQQAFGHPWHYSFEQKKIPFLVLNTADINGKYICPDLQWTEKELQRFASPPTMFVFMHITPFKWTDNGIDCPELVALFGKYPNVKAVFHGHDHDQDSVKEHNGKRYFFDSHLGGSWGTAYRGYRVVEVLKDGSVVSYQMNPVGENVINKNEIA